MDLNMDKTGVWMPWEEKKKEYAEIKGDEEPIKQWWETLDLYAVYYLWFTVTAM